MKLLNNCYNKPTSRNYYSIIFMKKTARTENIIPKTELREHLTAIMHMVLHEKKTIAVSDRGTIISIISPAEDAKKSTSLSKKTKIYDIKKHPAFGVLKDDPRSDNDIFGELSGTWW